MTLTKLEELYQTAHDHGIHVHNYSYSGTRKAACMTEGDYKAVAMDMPAIESTEEEQVLLAEELGHYETDSLYLLSINHNTALERSNRIKCEARAKRWAVFNCVPMDELMCAFEACKTSEGASVRALAEYLDVTVDFLLYAVDLYVRKAANE